ncbi:hypothetical protein, partial [Sulfitobacter sediminilitoris]|uniref:hypothetical protein n=1 Tax=Sulfitobacter sediminilitoris TaxID=2698830 RepID=UPI0019539902
MKSFGLDMGTQHNQFHLLSQLKEQSELIDSGADVRALAFSVEEPAPPDATRKFLVQTGYGLRAFVTCSSAGNPDLVARGVRKIAA